MNRNSAVILFDGVCNLCNGFVRFVIERDRAGRFVFAPLDSDLARDLLRGVALPEHGAIALVEGSRVLTSSDAVLRIVRGLRWPYPMLSVLTLVPARLREAVYALVARNRYRWFGRREECALPPPEAAGRFLE